MGGIPTASETMIPMRVPKSRLLQPLADEPELEEEPSPFPSLPTVGEVEEAGEVDEADDAGEPAVAIGPTLMVVVDAGWPGLVWSQLSIIAARAPL
jgi:hypothetical protein